MCPTLRGDGEEISALTSCNWLNEEVTGLEKVDSCTTYARYATIIIIIIIVYDHPYFVSMPLFDTTIYMQVPRISILTLQGQGGIKRMNCLVLKELNQNDKCLN